MEQQNVLFTTDIAQISVVYSDVPNETDEAELAACRTHFQEDVCGIATNLAGDALAAIICIFRRGYILSHCCKVPVLTISHVHVLFPCIIEIFIKCIGKFPSIFSVPL